MLQFADPKLKSLLSDQLEPGEKVLWVREGVGSVGRYSGFAYSTLINAMVFGFVVLMSLSIGAVIGVMQGNLGTLVLYSPVYLAVSLGPILLGVLMVQRTDTFAFAITNRRLLITNSKWPRFCSSVYPANVALIKRRKRKKVDEIIVEAHFLLPSVIPCPDDADHVEQLLRETLQRPVA